MLESLHRPTHTLTHTQKYCPIRPFAFVNQQKDIDIHSVRQASRTEQKVNLPIQILPANNSIVADNSHRYTDYLRVYQSIMDTDWTVNGWTDRRTDARTTGRVDVGHVRDCFRSRCLLCWHSSLEFVSRRRFSKRRRRNDEDDDGDVEQVWIEINLLHCWPLHVFQYICWWKGSHPRKITL